MSDSAGPSTAASTCCWRSMRPRPAAGSPATAAARAKSVALPASRLTVPGVGTTGPSVDVDDRPRRAEPHAGERVDGVAEAGEVQPDVAGDRQAGQLLHGAGGAAGAAEVERAGELRAGLCGHGVAGVGGRRGVVALAGGPGDLEVGGDGEHGHRAAAGGDVGDDDGVGPGRGAGCRGPVGGDEQHVLVAGLGGRRRRWRRTRDRARRPTATAAASQRCAPQPTPAAVTITAVTATAASRSRFGRRLGGCVVRRVGGLVAVSPRASGPRGRR